RQDLDTFLSKIDSGSIRDIVVLKGPYSARYGPGFSFIDIVTQSSPRYQEGFEVHGRTVTDSKTNGVQFYGQQRLLAAPEYWGVRVSYGQRRGNAYDTGADTRIEGGYDSREVNFILGLDLTTNSRIEFGYLRLDQTGLEFPGQIFDTQ